MRNYCQSNFVRFSSRSSLAVYFVKIHTMARNMIYLFLLTCSLYYVNCAGWKTTFSKNVQGNALSSTTWYVVESTDTIVAVQISDG